MADFCHRGQTDRQRKERKARRGGRGGEKGNTFLGRFQYARGQGSIASWMSGGSRREDRRIYAFWAIGKGVER